MAKYKIGFRNSIESELRIDPLFYLHESINSKRNGIKLSNFIDTPSSNFNPKKSYGNNYFSYIDISGVDNLTGLIRPKKIKGTDAPSRARKVVQTGDVIISSVRPEKNTVALITENENEFICSTGFIICRPNEKLIKSGYLFILLKSNSVISQLVRRTTATMYPTINQNDIINLDVSLQNIEVQEKISNAIFKNLETLYKCENEILKLIANLD